MSPEQVKQAVKGLSLEHHRNDAITIVFWDNIAPMDRTNAAIELSRMLNCDVCFSLQHARVMVRYLEHLEENQG